MKQTFLSTWRLGSLACLVGFHLCTVTASRAAILAGPITNAANGHIYYLLSPTNWPSAEAEAVSLGGHLATINDEEENAWVFNTFATNGGVARNLWLGLNDAAQEGTWLWASGEAAAYRNWAPGEPNNGGGFFPDEDQAVMRGPALSFPGSWNDAPSDQAHTPVVEVGIAAPPTNTGAYDVASGFSTNSNPNGVWSYGYSTILGAPMTLFSERGNWAGLNYWRAPILLGVPGVYRNPANVTVTNSTGTAVLGPGQLSFYPGPNGEFCIIRFTAPSNGIYQVSGAFTGVDPHGTTTDVHILVNGVIFNGYGAGSGPAFNLIVDFNAGAPIDFVVGRSANSQFSFDSTGLAVQISTSNAPPAGIPPAITSQPQSRTVNAGTNVSFFVTATGTTPLSYQWRRNGTNLAGATGTSLTLSNVQPANAGAYSVRVTNAFGSVVSSNAVLTVLATSTNCVSAPTGLVSWWRAESNAVDSVDSNHGTLAGNAAFGPGRVGSGFVFDGLGDGVSLGNPTNLQLQTFTCETWFRRISTNRATSDPGYQNGGLLHYGNGGYGFAIWDDGRLLLTKVGISATSSSVLRASDTNFHHAAVTKSGSSVIFYLDGVPEAAGAYDPGFVFNSPVAIGARGGDMAAALLGTIDELSVYNHALSASEIQGIYAAGSAGKCSSAAGIPPTITSQPQSRTVNAGTNVTFFVTATGTTPLSYQWRRNGSNLAGAMAASLTLSNVQPANAATYSVRVTNAFGAVTSSDAVLTVLSSSTNCVSAPTGLVSWWRAEGNAKDAVGTNNGTAPFGMSYAAGEVGGAFDFNGTNASVSVPAAASLDVGQGSGFSIECWIKPAQIANAQPLVEWFQSPGPPFGVHFWISEAGSGTGPGCLYVNIPDTFGGEHKFSSAKGIVGTNSWQHVALTYERASGLTKMFYNGTVVASRTLGFYTPQTSYGLYLGRRPSSTYPYQEAFFKGGMDEVAIYNRALSTNEIQAIFNAGSAGRCPPPTGIPPTITSQPQSRTVNVGTNVTFFVTATGTTPLSYQWRRNTTNVVGATGTSLTLTNVQAADAGIYSVRVTNAFGAVTSSNAVLTVLAPPTNCASAPTGLVSWWRAESNTVDSVDSNHGTLTGNATFGVGRVGQSFGFDGNGDGVRIGNPTNLQLQNFTIEAWVRRASSSVVTLGAGTADFFGYGTGGYAFGLFPDGRPYLSKAEIDETHGSAGITDTNFHHVAVTKSGSVVVFYIDGTAYPVALYNTTYTFSTPAAIGARGDNLTASFYGSIDELAIYNRALSASEVQGIYNADGFGKCAPPGGIPPAITSQPQSRTVNAGTNVTFFVTATGTAPLSYQWRRNETNLPGATGSSLTLSNVQPANAGTYSVRVTNAFGFVISSNAVLTVLSPPSPILAGPITNPANGHVYFLIASNTWTGAEAQAVNLGGHLVTINDSTENAWVLSTFGSFGGLARPLWIGLNDAAVEGAFVWVSGEVAAYRNWMPGEPNNGGGFVPDEDYVAMRGPGLSFSNAWNDTLDSDLYVGVVEIGSSGTAGVAPTITSQPQSRTVNAGTNVTFFVTATGTTPLSYQWRRNETNLAGATGTSLTLSNVQPANAGTYSVRVTNAFGVATSSNAVLTVAFASYDVSANYSLAANPNGVWRYGALSNLAGPLTLLTFSRTFGADNGVPIGEWNPGGVLHPHVNKVLGPGAAVSAGGAFVGPAGTVYFTPGEDRTAQNFGVIRFTVPAGAAGNYRIVTAVQPLFDGALSADADFHVDKNGVELFGQALAPNQGTSYSNTVALAAGDTIDFAIGRGADGILGTTGLKIQATVAQLTGTAGGPLGFTSLVRESGTTAKLCFAGVSGNAYTVQASTNLIDWKVVGIAVADSNGVCEFEDPDSTKFPCRYYRVGVPDQE